MEGADDLSSLRLPDVKIKRQSAQYRNSQFSIIEVKKSWYAKIFEAFSSYLKARISY